MAKLGRYSADRKKIKALTANHTATVAECGTIFTADSSGGAITVTLPSPSEAGKGWWCKVVRVDDHINNVTVAVGGNQVYGLEITGGFTEISDTSDIVLAGAQVGLQVEMISDGTNWLAVALGRTAADINP